MKILYFNDFRLGELKGDTVVDVTSVVKNLPHSSPGDQINGLIARFDEFRVPLERAVTSGKGLPVAQVKTSISPLVSRQISGPVVSTCASRLTTLSKCCAQIAVGSSSASRPAIFW